MGCASSAFSGDLFGGRAREIGRRQTGLLDSGPGRSRLEDVRVVAMTGPSAARGYELGRQQPGAARGYEPGQRPGVTGIVAIAVVWWFVAVAGPSKSPEHKPGRQRPSVTGIVSPTAVWRFIAAAGPSASRVHELGRHRPSGAGGGAPAAV